MGCCKNKAGCRGQADAFKLHFGPNNAYTIIIPATEYSTRQGLAAQLRAAADALEETPRTPDQKTFPFMGE